MFEPDVSGRLLRRLDLGKDSFGEVYEEESSRLMVRSLAGDLLIETQNEGGAGLRTVTDQSTDYRYADGFDPDALLSGELNCAPANGKRVKRRGRFDFSQETPALVNAVRCAAEKAAGGDERLRSLDVSLSARKKGFRVHNTDGLWASCESFRAELTVKAVLRHGARSGLGYESLAFTRPDAQLEQEAAAMAIRAVRSAAMSMESGPFEDGAMDAVFMGQATGVLIHETLGHHLEADALNSERHELASLVGRRIAPSAVTLIDDPSLAGLWGSYGFDDEGARAVPAVLIEKGILAGFLTDRLSRLVGLRGSMGSARRESFRHPPLPRMSNTYLAPGIVDPEEIVATTRRGILVRRMRAGSINPLSGNFVLYVSDGHLIEDGELIRPLSNLLIMGSRNAALGGIEQVGSDLSFSREAAWCRKKGQTVPISQGGPTLKISGLYILAKQEPAPSI